MPYQTERKPVKSGNSAVIVLDKTLREVSGFKVGEDLHFTVEPGKIVIEAIKIKGDKK